MKVYNGWRYSKDGGRVMMMRVLGWHQL